MREQFKKSKLYSAQENPNSYLALFRRSKLRKYRWVENASLEIFLIISLVLRGLEQGCSRVLFKEDTINKDKDTHTHQYEGTRWAKQL